MEPTIASTAVSRSRMFKMYSGEAPSAFKMPISRVRSSTAVYIVERTIRNPTTTPTLTTTQINEVSIGTFAGEKRLV